MASIMTNALGSPNFEICLRRFFDGETVEIGEYEDSLVDNRILHPVDKGGRIRTYQC